MGGSVQWRRKNAGNGGKKPEVPKTALEQLRSRFGGKFVDDIQGPHAEGMARGIIVATDYFGDKLVDGVRVYNRGDGVQKGRGVVLGETNHATGEVWVAENEMDGTYERRGWHGVVNGQDVEGTTVAVTTHELTHMATSRYATQEIRDYNNTRETLLAENNISTADFMKAWDTRRFDKGIIYLASKGMDPGDAYEALKATDKGLQATAAFCKLVVQDAKKGSGIGRIGDFQLTISERATANYNETVSEAFADYFANGELAHPNSIRIVHSYEKLSN
jgi:hypothetical protein